MKEKTDVKHDTVNTEHHAMHLHRYSPEDKVYRFGFWLFFTMIILSVIFSVWAITSIYKGFQVVKTILDESFERTNLVLDVTSSRMSLCQTQLKECRQVTGAAVSNSTPIQ